jgi:hypothetical protein
MSTKDSPASGRAIASWRWWCVNFGLRPIPPLWLWRALGPRWCGCGSIPVRTRRGGDGLRMKYALAKVLASGVSQCLSSRIKSSVDNETLRDGRLCLSKIKSEHIRGAIHRGLGGKEYALPSSRCAIGARPYPRPSACASHYSRERKISGPDANASRPRQ